MSSFSFLSSTIFTPGPSDIPPQLPWTGLPPSNFAVQASMAATRASRMTVPHTPPCRICTACREFASRPTAQTSRAAIHASRAATRASRIMVTPMLSMPSMPPLGLGPMCQFCPTCQGCVVCPLFPQAGQQHDHSQSLCKTCQSCLRCPQGGNQYMHRLHLNKYSARRAAQVASQQQTVSVPSEPQTAGPNGTTAQSVPEEPASEAEHEKAEPRNRPGNQTQPVLATTHTHHFPTTLRQFPGAITKVNPAAFDITSGPPQHSRLHRFVPAYLFGTPAGSNGHSASRPSSSISGDGGRRSRHVHFAT